MSVLIKGIRKTDCSICVVGNRTICANGCRMVEVPPHGRLIDADAIPYKKIMYDEETDEFYYGVTKPYIDRMPTIIEAEEET